MRTLAKEYETMVTQGDATILTEDAYHQLITYYESELLFERALDIADKAMEVYSFTPEFFIRKADILLSLKLGDEALDQLIKAEGIAPSEIHISLVETNPRRPQVLQ
jgi:tetratricopeptide (TPR) repeat protein